MRLLTYRHDPAMVYVISLLLVKLSVLSSRLIVVNFH